MSIIHIPKIGIGLSIVTLGSVALLLTIHYNFARHSVGSEFSPPTIVHSAAWYMTHPDLLRLDEQRCAGDASTITPAACQNVASADARLAGMDYAKAAKALSAKANGNRDQNSP